MEIQIKAERKKKVRGQIIIVFALMLICASCTQEDDFVPRDHLEGNWESPSYEEITAKTPIHISKRDLLKLTNNAYFTQELAFQCSDSLGKVCFWDGADTPTFNMNEGSFSHGVVGFPAIYPLFRFCKNYAHRYERIPLFGNPPEIKARKLYWGYDAKTGTMIWGHIPIDQFDQSEESFLLGLTERYMIIKTNHAIASKHATHTIYVYRAMGEKEAAKRWYIYSEDAE